MTKDTKDSFSYDPLGGEVNFAQTENTTTEKTTETTLPVNNAEVTPKRGRGRPPKNAATVTPEKENAVMNKNTLKDPIQLLLNYIGSKVITITPVLAKHVLAHCNKLNRKLNKRWVKTLADSITRGEWQLNGESIIFSKDYVLIDGQHRLHAIVMANKDIETYVTTDVDRNTFPTVDTGHSRTGSHVIAIDNPKVKHSFDVSATLNKLNRFYSKNYDFDGANVISNRQLVILLEQHKNVIKSVEFARQFPKGYSKSTIAFCHFILSGIDMELTDRFFEQLASHTPTIPLIIALRKGTLKEGRAKSRIKQTVVIGSIFKTWNAMRTNDVNASAIISATEEFPIPK